MKRLYGINAFLALAIGISLTACSDKEKEPEVPGGGGSGEMTQLTPEESKKFIESTATKAMNMLNPEDQRDAIEVCAYFSEKYGELELPSNFEMEEGYSYRLGDFFKTMGDAIKSGDGASMTRAAYEYVYNLNFYNYTGVYQPGSYRWQKTDNSDNVVFEFTDSKGTKCELKAQGSNNFSDGQFNFSITDSEYDYNIGDNIYYDKSYHVSFVVPKEVKLTLTRGSETLVSTNINTNIDLGGKKVDSDIEITVANLYVKSTVNITNTKVTENVTSTVGGTTFFTSNGVVTGNNLCDISYIDQYFTNSYDESLISQGFAGMLKEGTAFLNFLDEVQVDGHMTYKKEIYSAFELWYDSLSASQNAANILNNNIEGKVRYNNTSTVQANIVWGFEATEWDDEWFHVMPMIAFPDGTKYVLDEYFNTGFSGMENTWKSLLRKYRSFWNSVQKY